MLKTTELSDIPAFKKNNGNSEVIKFGVDQSAIK